MNFDLEVPDSPESKVVVDQEPTKVVRGQPVHIEKSIHLNFFDVMVGIGGVWKTRTRA